MARVLFIQKMQLMQNENIAVMQIASFLKLHGHICDVIIPHLANEDLIESIKIFKPNIIAFSLMTIESEWVLQHATLIKQHDSTLIIAGGPHPTFFPDFINNECIDIINIGEGEYSMLELANALDKNKNITKIKNLYVKKNGTIYKNSLRPLIDINTLPEPNRDLYLKYNAFKKQKIYNFITSRGCPYLCNFCFIHQWKNIYKNDPKKNRIRLRSIRTCIDEIKNFSQKVNIQLVTFADSTFNIDKKWTIELLNSYRTEIGIPFTINIRANLIDEEIIRAIAETNCCHSVRIGIEVGNEKFRKEILRKNISNEAIYKTIDLLKKYKINIVLFTMYGLPGETLHNAFETIEMLQRIKPFSFSSQLFHPYPGLEITKYALKNDYLKNKDLLLLGLEQYKFLKSVLQQPEIEEVTNALKLSILAIKFPFLMPLIKKIVKIKPNILFNYIYMITSFLMLRKYTIVSTFLKQK